MLRLKSTISNLDVHGEHRFPHAEVQVRCARACRIRVRRAESCRIALTWDVDLKRVEHGREERLQIVGVPRAHLHESWLWKRVSKVQLDLTSSSKKVPCV